jgi:hypothetical protein
MLATWVFGSSAVGKKHFIRSEAAYPFTPSWMEDGDEPPEWKEKGAYLIRWQWGRERYIERLRDLGAAQCLLLIVCDPITQMERLKKREDSDWTLDNLVGESQTIRGLVQELTLKFGLPGIEINTTVSDPRRWTRRTLV